MNNFFVELMNRLPHFLTQSIDYYDDGLHESVFFSGLFSYLEKTAFDLLVFGSLQRDSAQILLLKLLLE